ncbi:alpha/beta hydrolase [Amycolatopsis circi]|uniref:alpha/beta hydrolase n=1 Tax=Amycolatopsis circi TaxID=871959 RepID=UPI000E26CD75|nr:alpha/beta hydrolase [Amycolatopsis circi]
MPSKEWSELRETFAACAPKAVAATTAAVLAIDPGIDLGGADLFHGLAKEPTDVTYEEVTAAGLPALWANPLGCGTGRVLVYFHGGGFVSGSKDSYRKIAAHLAKAAGVRTLIPDYRLAPAHPFPAQLEDARSLYDWLLSQGCSPSGIAFTGDSAGGNIATSAALSLHRDGLAAPAAIVAFSPWYDMEANGPTFESNADVDVAISRELVHSFAPMFLDGQSPADPLANPMHADPAGLPPLFLTCGGDETLRDSVERFAALAGKTGVEVALHVADGMPHVYQLLAGRLPEADASIAEAGKWLRGKLGD